MKRYFFLTLLILLFSFWICQDNPISAQVMGNSVIQGPTISLRGPGSSVLSRFRAYSSSIEFDADRYSRGQSNLLAFNQRSSRNQMNIGTPSVLSRSNKFLANTVSNRLDSARIKPGVAFQNLDNLLTANPPRHSSRALAKSRITSVENQLGPI